MTEALEFGMGNAECGMNDKPESRRMRAQIQVNHG